MLKGYLLKDLAKQVGCTESMLSKIENGKVAPSMDLLYAIVGSVGGNAGYLFAEEKSETPVISAEDRLIIDYDRTGRSEGIRLERLIPYSNSVLLQANIHNVEPGGGRTAAVVHEGEEVGYVLEGEIELTVDGNSYPVKTGDAFHFRSDLPHYYRNSGTVPARIIWVNTPPSYSIQAVRELPPDKDEQEDIKAES